MRPATRSRACDGLVPRRARLVEDREPVALSVVRPLGRERQAGPGKHLEVVVGIGHGLDVGVLEDPHDIADRHAVGEARLPLRIVSARELEEGVVGGAAVKRLDERCELRGDPSVHLDDLGRPRRRDEELDVEEAALEAERRENPGGDVGELRLPLLGESRRIVEALEAERSLVLDGVGHANRDHRASVDVALERHFVAGQELLADEPVHPSGSPPAIAAISA